VHVDGGAILTSRSGRSPHHVRSFQLLESKLGPPAVRPGLVPRTSLVRRLTAADAAPVICVVAPPGYGKTTLLAQWAQRKGDRVAWVSVDPRDNDPVVLLAYVAEALDRVEPIDRQVFRTLASPGISPAVVVPRIAAALASMRGPVALILDDLEALESTQCLDAVMELALNLPRGAQLVLASRFSPPLPMARLRAQGRIMEVGVEDLTMDKVEARALLEAAGTRLAGQELADLVERTEGWPAGLYLAALADKAGASGKDGLAFTGDDRFMADYLRSEVLEHLSPRTVWFLTRTSVLDRMSASLCDAVLEAKGSAQVLASMEEANLLLIPLDRHRGWYRYHHLFRELLLAELNRQEPHLATELHARAAGWYQANDLPELAIDHAQEAGDADQVAELVAVLVQPTYASGRWATTRRWMTWLEGHAPVERYPQTAVNAAWLQAVAGQPAGAERWTMAAERGAADAPAGDLIHASLALLHALLCRDGIERMGADARRARQPSGPGTPWPTTGLLLEGLADLLAGDQDRADTVLSEAVAVGTERKALPSVSVALAERALIAIGRGRWDFAESLAERALETVSAGRLEDYVTSLLVYAVGARVAVRRGDPARAREYLVAATRLRPLQTYAIPHLAVQSLLELVRAHLALDDAAGARVVLRETRDILRLRPDLGILPGQADELQATFETIGAGTAGASSLTTAELRLVPLLATHLSFREMGARLFVSGHTVKAQALSVYRKLGVSSRSGAVERLRETGLLGV
jgi:LuxR family maltose regulon positive regulatory protein